MSVRSRFLRFLNGVGKFLRLSFETHEKLKFALKSPRDVSSLPSTDDAFLRTLRISIVVVVYLSSIPALNMDFYLNTMSNFIRVSGGRIYSVYFPGSLKHALRKAVHGGMTSYFSRYRSMPLRPFIPIWCGDTPQVNRQWYCYPRYYSCTKSMGPPRRYSLYHHLPAVLLYAPSLQQIALILLAI